MISIKEIKRRITIDNILNILKDLNAEAIQSNNPNEIICRTICHSGDKHKLYFYKDTKTFYCYTHCGALDIVELVKSARGYNLQEAINYITQKCDIHKSDFVFGFNHQNDIVCEDLELLNEIVNNEVKDQLNCKELSVIDDKVLLKFYDIFHKSFIDDYISMTAMYKYEIKFDILNNRIIIPHRNYNGDLIAVRSRNLEEHLVNNGLKYTPITIDNRKLVAPTGQYFYGLYHNMDNIKEAKKVVLVESEKGVMQYETFFPNNNICLALCGSYLSQYQIDILINLGVEEVILALDKEFEIIGTVEELAYANKIKNTLVKRLNFCNVSVLWDYNNKLKSKQSPLDMGKDVFKEMLNNRKYI